MAPVVIPTGRVRFMTETVTEVISTVTNATDTFLSVENSTNTVSTKTASVPNNTVPTTVSTTLSVRTFTSSQFWPSPDDGGFHSLNTPLNAPEPSLGPATGLPDNGGLLGSSATDDLGWIIPVAIVVIVAMVGVAFACYFGVRALELRMLGWCYRNCSCCCKPESQGRRLLGGERYDNLSEDVDSSRRRESVRLRDFRERSPTYGVSRSSDKGYTPPANPFDDDS